MSGHITTRGSQTRRFHAVRGQYGNYQHVAGYRPQPERDEEQQIDHDHFAAWDRYQAAVGTPDVLALSGRLVAAMGR